MENVIKLSEHSFKIKRNAYLQEKSDCKHFHVVLEEHGGLVTCEDCQASLSPYWVLKHVLEQINDARSRINRDREQIREDRLANITLKAAKEVQSAWRSKNMVPACPHCHRGIFASDGLGYAQVNKEIELRRREVAKHKDL